MTHFTFLQFEIEEDVTYHSKKILRGNLKRKRSINII